MSVEVVERRQLYVPAQRRGLRFIAQDVLTSQFLHWDLPIRDAEITYVLSGSKSITGALSPEFPEIADLGLTPRNTWIHAEEDGQIRGSGILQPGSLEGDSLKIDCAGFASYPHLIPYRGEYSVIGEDTLNIVRHIYSHVQSFPSGDLNVTLDPLLSGVKLGTQKKDVEFETSSGSDVAFESGPYELNWWTSKNCGQEIDELAKQTPFDFLERDRWNDDKTEVLHHVQFGYPRVGGKKQNLTFTQDTNIVEVIPIAEDESLYCTEVHVLGAGEGRKRVQGSYVGSTSSRVRVPVVIEDSSYTTVARARAAAEAEYHRRQATTGVESIVIDARHENAQLGTFSEGDDILVQAKVPYLGRIALWHRITEYATSENNAKAVLKLRRSDTFAGGAPRQ